MGVYLKFDDAPAESLASNTGWSDVLDWLEELPHGIAPTLRHLGEFGWEQDLDDLKREIVAAIRKKKPSRSVTATLVNLSQLLVDMPVGTEAIHVTNGMEVDDGSPDEEDPPPKQPTAAKPMIKKPALTGLASSSSAVKAKDRYRLPPLPRYNPMAEQADALINTVSPSPRQAELLLSSWQAWDYYNNRPYPRHAFGPEQWSLDQGPIPTALPLPQILIEEGAGFIFRNGGPLWSVAEDDNADELLQEILSQNKVDSQYIPTAEANGNQGAMACKFSIDANDPDCPVRISWLSVPQECRVWVDAHDINRILMARIQYPYRDQSDGKWYYHREEWTDDWFVTYKPRFAGASTIGAISDIPGYSMNLGDLGDGTGAWEIDTKEANDFGVIPVGVVPNRRVKGNPLGVGDLWRLYPLIDRIARTMHGEDSANQLHSDPTKVALNARIDNTGPPAPGEILVINKDSETGPPPDLKMLEPHGRARAFSFQSIDTWKGLLYDASGLSLVDESVIGNKGNLTSLALSMIYSKTISTTDRKRQLWADGFGDFLRRMLVGLRNLGGFARSEKVHDDLTVSCAWPDYFASTDSDKATVTDRTVKQVDKGLLTPERGAERVAVAEGMPKSEVATLLLELKALKASRGLTADAASAATDQASDNVGSFDDATGALGGDDQFDS